MIKAIKRLSYLMILKVVDNALPFKSEASNCEVEGEVRGAISWVALFLLSWQDGKR